SNNLRFMSTKPSSYGGYRGIYDSPYDAFTNYMNIVGDFITRVNNLYPADIENEELNSLLTTIKNQGDELAMKDKEIEKLQHMLAKLEKAQEKAAAPKAKAAPAKKKAEPKAEVAEKPAAKAKAEVAEEKKAPAKKPAAKKTTKKAAEKK
ncbi:MAG: alpha-amylase, partial [Bacteroidaceae bacterium]|nr:alpha-amylase [Bacteroidaceae bacterium]